MKVRVGIIGGSGLNKLLPKSVEKDVKTPYGKPSDKISVGNLNGKKVAFLPRHGKKHTIPPHKINHRANIFALKTLGVENVISSASVGIINTEIKIGDFIILDDFIDFTKKPYTFFDEFDKESKHVGLTNPFSARIRKILINICKEKKYSFHETGTYVNTCGPRLETPSEIKMFKIMGADAVGMTVAPEAILSREANIEYACIAVAVNLACGISKKPIVLKKAKEVFEERKPRLIELIKETMKKI